MPVEGTHAVRYTVDIADMKVSNNPEDVLVTYALGSCIGVAVYDPQACVGGLIHCQLPLSKMNPEKAAANPYLFTDTGVAELLRTVFSMGAQKSRLIVKVAGGSNLLDEKGTFKIGERNYTVLRKILWKNGILIKAESVGGSISRTMQLFMSDGTITIKSSGQEVLL